MTAGHRHRTIHVRRGGLAERILRGPTLAKTRDRAYVERSRLVWGADSVEGPYRLTPLGLLHGLTGLTLEVD